MIKITPQFSIADSDIEITAIRAQGAGGQNVNKVSSAIHLRFDIKASSLPDFYKQRLLNIRDKRINKDYIIVIKAQQYRTREKNKKDAIDRLIEIIQQAWTTPKVRRVTKPSKNSKLKRLDNKAKRSKTKVLRGKIKL